MTTGRISITALNLRSTPGGPVIGVLRLNERVTISGAGQNGWLPVSLTQDGKLMAGWVSGAYIALEAPAPAALLAGTALPPADTTANPVRLDGRKAVAPDGTVFAWLQSAGGFYTSGITSIARWAAGQTMPPPLSASLLRVLEAVEKNEALFEGINSYDDAYLSFGFQQWTLGPNNEAGELPGLLAQVKTSDADAFEDCFGRYGISVKMTEANSGFLALNGVAIDTGPQKDSFRDITWAYRFWRAGHHPSVRQCEVSLAASRIGIARAGAIRNLPVSAWLTSEHGVALLLDEHVNRPSHVPGTLGNAVDALANAGGLIDPARWTDSEEGKLITYYEQAREQTTMTDPAGRARNIAQAVIACQLSNDRGSFVP